jgi:TatD DNase family protein
MESKFCMAEVTINLVDYHCHLDLYPDSEGVFAECSQHGVATLAVTTTPQAWPKNKEMAERFPAVRVALGLHPQLVAERGAEIRIFEKFFPETRFIGEVGLDAGPQFYRSINQQKQIFERVLQMCNEAGGRILSVHAVRTTRDILALVEKHLPQERGRVVLHWFNGTKSEAELAARLGCYFSVNAQMLASPKRQPIVAGLPLQLILTETDGPLTNVGDRPARPCDTAETVSVLAGLFRMSKDLMQKQILNNLIDLEAL